MEVFELLAVAVAGALWSAVLVVFLHKKDVHPIRELLDGFSRLGWMCKVGVLFFVVQLTMFGGAKHGGTNGVDGVTGTNDVNVVEGSTNWLEAMLNFPVTTNDYGNYSLWMNEKVRWVSGYARRFVDVEHTNLWFQVADLLHDLRAGMRSNEDLLHAVADECRRIAANVADTNTFTVTSGMPAWYWREIDHMAIRQQFAGIVRVSIVEQFGSRGIPRLPKDERWSFYSNFVERACLNENDRAEIRRAIETKEEKEGK